MKQKRVLHILGTARPEGTGIARMVGALASGLDPERYRVDAWFLGGYGPLATMLETAGAQVRVFDWRRGIRDAAGGLQFLRALRKEEFAIVHQHFGGRARRWLVRRAAHSRLVIHLHGSMTESRGLNSVAIPVRRADAVIAVSRAVAKTVVGVRPQVVYPGVCISDDAGGAVVPRTQPGRVLGTAGRLVPIKGIVYLIRALGLLREEFPALRLEIAGSGTDRKVLESEVQSHGLADRVTFLGWREDLYRVLAGWDIFVLASLDEGFPIAVLEAMAAGLPVIASNVGGLPELVENGRTGWLVPPAQPTALAQRLRMLLRNPEQQRVMGAAGQARARERFSMGQMVGSISKIYETILESHGQR